MKGCDIIVDALRKEKVEVLFGYPGGSVMDIFDSLYESPIRFILTRHEQAAAHAADGYARASGKVGVCIATSGPGATNLVTGIATAAMDSVPLVALTGQVSTPMIGNDAFQEADIVGITRPITKHNYLVKDVDDLPRILKEAFIIAATGRPGPVLVDLPKDVVRADSSVPYPASIELRGYKPTYEGHPQQIKRAAAEIAKAKRPVIYVGGGAIISNADKEVTALAVKAGIPVTSTLMGLGAFPETHELSLGMLGMHGTVYANYAVAEADLIVAIGARFDDRVTGKLSAFASRARIVHIDIDPTSVHKNVKVDVPIVGDVKQVLRELVKIVKRCDDAEWLARIEEWKKKHPLSYRRKDGLKPQFVIEKLRELTGGDAIIATDVGQHQMWAGQYCKIVKPRTFLSSGGLGTMGYGFPAGLGAQAAFPKRLVAVISGDGGFQMNIQELATAVENDLPVKVLILNNRYLGMVRQWQELFYRKRYSSTCLARNIHCPAVCDGTAGKCPPYVPDFVKVAEAYGCTGMRVKAEKEVIPALRDAFATRGPVVVEFEVAREENVFPMVPAGESVKEMIKGVELV
ncbi:MAG: biosynthetic-type acetolactate synthase large subunit [Candidatus Aureabacteria bacterium]|nr:biosynthetic-type acetolactate synthase large subunit [Candidatus Auribacterota bacterium]HOE27942.1 biosynthetic-type acetolactate synthase large subunit [bacterium]HQM52593.1 biosynthetic-type acetolactate synthase large subunit [bacterium]